MNIGDTYSLVSAAFEGASGLGSNECHRYFTAKAEANGFKLRESFKF
jgi:hypothetical protein